MAEEAAAYDLDALKRGLESIRENIRAIGEALEQEYAKEREYVALIAAARVILDLHGVDDDGRPKRS